MLELSFARSSGAVAAGLLLVGAAASTSGGTSAAQARVVVIENVQFSPQNLIVKAGERITWANKDLFPHTATGDGKSFDSRAIAPNASWSWVAGKPGTYAYGCTFHPTMKGTVTVQ